MSGAVATGQAATAPRERGWRWFVLALAAVILATLAPAWPPALALAAAVVRLVLPIEQWALLTVVPLAACAFVGWWSGGRTWVLLLVGGAVALVLFAMPLAGDGYGSFVRGWSLALSAAFGLVSLIGNNRAFVGRALAAVAITFAVTAVGVGARFQYGGAMSGLHQLVDREYGRRLESSLGAWRGRTESAAWHAFAARVPVLAARAEGLAAELELLNRSPETRSRSLVVTMAPALLGLESMLALALAWTAYHRLARTRIGPPLCPLQDLRFHDQLVWGLVVGSVLVLLPTLQNWRVAGFNLLCFFGALYALRGVAVLAWWIPDRAALPLMLALLVLILVLGPAFLLMAVAAICFGVGLSDTWRDFRNVARVR